MDKTLIGLYLIYMPVSKNNLIYSLYNNELLFNIYNLYIKATKLTAMILLFLN